MKFQVQLEGRRSSNPTHVQMDVQLEIEENSLRAELGDQTIEADWVELRPGVYSILLDGRSFEAHLEPDETDSSCYRVLVDGNLFQIGIADPRVRRSRSVFTAPAEGKQEIRAPMPGKIARVLVDKGQAVEAGEGLVVIEAMKMQNEIAAPQKGRVAEISVSEGDRVETGEKLLEVDSPES